MNKFYKLNAYWALTVNMGYDIPWGYKNKNKNNPFPQASQSLVRKTNR